MDDILQGMSFEQFELIGSRDPAFWIERVCDFEYERGPILKWFHHEWIDLFMKHDRLNIMAPTGHGKSAVFAIGLPLWLAWYRRNKKILIMSNTIEQATKLLERIVDEIANNELLKLLEPKEKKFSWSKTEINTTTGIKIFCKPYNMNIRSYHVDFIFADEISQYRDHSIFERYVITRVTAKGGKLVTFTTPYTAVDLSHKLIKNPIFYTRIYTTLKNQAILDRWKRETDKLHEAGQKDKQLYSDPYLTMEEDEPIFPELYPPKVLEEIKKSQGQIAFDREYMCNVLTLEDSIFPPGLVVECFDEKEEFIYQVCPNATYVGIDFAAGTGKQADYFVITVVEHDGKHSYIRHMEKHKGMAISEQKRRIIDVFETFKPVSVRLDASYYGVEVFQELQSKQVPVIDCKFDHNSRRRYLLSLRKEIEDKKLKIPRKGSLTETVTDELFIELTSFITKTSPSGMEIFQTTAAHDDMVMSLALAISGLSIPNPETSKIFYTA